MSKTYETLNDSPKKLMLGHNVAKFLKISHHFRGFIYKKTSCQYLKIPVLHVKKEWWQKISIRARILIE